MGRDSQTGRLDSREEWRERETEKETRDLAREAEEGGTLERCSLQGKDRHSQGGTETERQKDDRRADVTERVLKGGRRD